ncbi:MAG TPA: PAS domain S-box protein, partial [Roseiflexaceae bacterium]
AHRFQILAAMIASVRANSPPAERLALQDRNRQLSDAVIAQLAAMQTEQQRLLATRQAHARQTRRLTLDAIGLSMLLGLAGGVAAMLLFTSGVTRRASHLESNAERLAGGLPLLAPLPGNDALGALDRRLDRAAVLLRDREDALRQAQALLEHVVTWSPMVMFRGILGGTKSRYVSPNADRLLGYQPEQITTAGDFWVEHLHPDDRERFASELRQATGERRSELEQEYQFLHHDGSYRRLYGVTRLAYDDAGGLVDTLGYVLDVTERWRANQAMREREATLQAIISASPDIITILGPDGRVRFLSPALRRIVGLSPDDNVGENAFRPNHVHPDDRDDFVQAQQRVLSGQARQAVARVRVHHSAGHWVVLEAHTRPLGDDEGVVIVARDITGRQQAEEDLQEAKLAAEQANEAKSEYLSRMSHELRTPLNAILGFAQLLELDDLAVPQRDSLRHILAGARHLLGLINEVLDIAAIEAGRLPLSLEPVAVADIATETVGLIRPLADKHAIILGGAPPTCDAY